MDFCGFFFQFWYHEMKIFTTEIQDLYAEFYDSLSSVLMLSVLIAWSVDQYAQLLEIDCLKKVKIS